ncbi:MAG TPA: PTS sugar transporter subunit IIA [bacterium]|nr:PTS sugar transporter subunit IIA [bacterium]HPQ65147.1 PTS sugar transporter subunit IIA [bacterium]
MTIEEVARLLRVSERTVYDWAQRGDIPAGKLGNSWRFKRSRINQWLDEKLAAGKPPPAYPVDLSTILNPARILIIDVSGKKEALDLLIDAIVDTTDIKDRAALAEGIFHREELMSTGIGGGIGIPHVRIPSVTKLVMAMGVNKRDIPDYTSLDSTPVRIICMIAAGKNQHSDYLQTLAALGARLRRRDFRERILTAESSEEIYRIVAEEDVS